MRFLFGLILALFTFFQVKAQHTFLKHQNDVFTTSTSQYLIQQIETNHRDLFDCEKNNGTWNLPKPGNFNLLGLEIQINENEIKQCEELWFPGKSCDRFLKLMSVCDLYFPLFRKQCEGYALHDDYRYLPLLLSGCNQSYRSADNKSGLWAMDYLVARRQHLRIDSLVDERCGGDFSSKAAIQFIKELEEKYRFDHFRTLLAYVEGAPIVEKIPEMVTGQDLIDGLPSDTRTLFIFYAYTKSLIESARLSNQLNTYFDILGQFEPLQHQQVVRKQALAEIIGSNLSTLQAVNPVYVGSSIPIGYRKVPFMLDKVEALRFEALSDSVYNWRPSIPVLPEIAMIEQEEVIYYKVKKGDSLGKIASKYGISVKQLKSWNNLRSDKISKGKKLKIIRTKKVNVPTTAKKPEEEEGPKTISDTETPSTANSKASEDLTQQIGKMEEQANAFLRQKEYDKAIIQYQKIMELGGDQEVYEKKIGEARKAKKSAGTDKKKVTYTVKSGDSLWTIAKKYPGVSDKDIMKWNNCNENLRPGQKLIIYPKK